MNKYVKATRVLLSVLSLLGLLSQPTAMAAPLENKAVAKFDWFEYQGDDELFRRPLKDGYYRNPILTGYYPDPSVVAVGKDYYMVNSTFGFYPGLPVFHSRDLVNWQQISNAVDRADMMPFDGIKLGQNGLYAATIEYHDGVFYILNTCVACGGNFVLTAKDPAGPWSDPIWMPHIGGIDPSLFIDSDGKYYVTHNDKAPNSRYFGHTVIRVQQVHPLTFAPVGKSTIIWDGGDETPWDTVWLEGPHIYKVNGEYILSAPGGGTGYWHQQLSFKASNIKGPYKANPNNPILTQFDLRDDRPDPITATGHADLFQDANGDWWAVFLGNRVYDLPTTDDPGNFHTGRETFMLPVRWKKGWPLVLASGKAVPLQVKRPNLPDTGPASRPTTGNYTIKDEFSDKELGLAWLFARTPKKTWWSLTHGKLNITPRSERMGDMKQPSFIGQRLAHMRAQITTKMQYSPESAGDEAGLMAVQNDRYYLALGLGMDDNGDQVIRLRQRVGKDHPARGSILREQKVELAKDADLYLRMSVNKHELDAYYSTDGKTFTKLYDNANAKLLTTKVAGGFVGAVAGPYAETAGR